jgi:uncharacterized membrane protein YeaQ/YmgE (transglycosylase-associated protein family)
MPGPAAGGIRVAALIGLLGAVIGGFLGTTFLVATSAPFDLKSLLMAANGAIYPLFVYRCIALRFYDPIRTTAAILMTHRLASSTSPPPKAMI